MGAIKNALQSIAQSAAEGLEQSTTILYGKIVDVDTSLCTCDVEVVGLGGKRRTYLGVRSPVTVPGVDIPTVRIGNMVALAITSRDESNPVILGAQYRANYQDNTVDSLDTLVADRVIKPDTELFYQDPDTAEESVTATLVAFEGESSRDLLAHTGEIRLIPFGEDGPIIHLRDDYTLTISVPSPTKDSDTQTTPSMEIILDGVSKTLSISAPKLKLSGESVEITTSNPYGLKWNGKSVNPSLLGEESDVNMLLPKGELMGEKMPTVKFITGVPGEGQRLADFYQEVLDKTPLFAKNQKRSLTDKLKEII